MQPDGTNTFGGYSDSIVVKEHFVLRVAVITRSKEKTRAARKLGAMATLISTDRKAMEQHELAFDFILNTIPDPFDVNPYVKLLKRDGTLVAVGALAPYSKSTDNSEVAFHRRNVTGSLIGGVAETQEVLDFCAKHGIAADVEVIPIQDINDAFDRMQEGEVRFRYVIDMETLADDRD